MRYHSPASRSCTALLLAVVMQAASWHALTGAVAAQEVTKTASSTGATETIKRAITRVRALLAKLAPPGSDAARRVDEQLTAELGTLLDIDDLAKRALIDHWGSMTSDQQEAIGTALRKIVEKSFLAQLRGKVSHEIQYLAELYRDSDVIVQTIVKTAREGRTLEISVNYALRNDSGRWRAFDIVTDEVSMVRNYRSQFNRIITKEGVDGLIAKMRTKGEASDSR